MTSRRKRRQQHSRDCTIFNSSFSSTKISIEWTSSSDSNDDENSLKKSRIEIDDNESNPFRDLSTNIFNIEVDTAQTNIKDSFVIEEFDEDESKRMSFTIEEFDENKENNSIMLSDKDFSGDSISFSDVKNSTAISDSLEETWGDSSNSLNSSNLQILNGGLDIDFKHRKYKGRRKYEESTTILGQLDQAINRKRSEVAIWKHELAKNSKKSDVLTKKFKIFKITRKYGLVDLNAVPFDDTSCLCTLVLNTKFDFDKYFDSDNQLIEIHPPYKCQLIQHQGQFKTVYSNLYRIFICKNQ